MWKTLLTRIRVKRSVHRTRKRLTNNLCDYRKPFTAIDLQNLYRLLEVQGADVLISRTVNERMVQVSLIHSKIDLFSFHIKYIASNTDIIMKIAVRASNSLSEDNGIISLTVESIRDLNYHRYRRIIERSYEFKDSIDYKNLISNSKTTNLEENLITVKKILASSFEVIIDNIIDWRHLS